MDATLLKTGKCRRLYDHWHALRSAQDIPHLRTFLDRPDPVLQPNVLIADVIDETHIRVRLFATRLVAMAGVELTGANMLKHASPRMAQQLWRATSSITGHPCGLLSTKIATTASGRDITVEEISFPLTPFDGGPPCLVSCVELVEALDYKDTVFRVVTYVSATWIDVGWGVPALSLTD